MLWIWGLDAEGKKIKKALAEAGTEKSLMKDWLLLYKKIRRNMAPVTNHYHRVKEYARRLLTESKELEQMFRQEDALSEQQKGRCREILKDYTATEPLLDFEFVISHADKEIHMTLQNMERLGTEWLSGSKDALILQSEIENLIAMIQEALEKQKPDLSKLAVFYVNHSDRELEDISYSSRLQLVEETYQKEYIDPIKDALQSAMKQGSFAESDAGVYLDSIVQI